MATAELHDPRVIEFDVRTDEMLINRGPRRSSFHGTLQRNLEAISRFVRGEGER